MTPAEVYAMIKSKLEIQNEIRKEEDRLDGIRTFLFYQEYYRSKSDKPHRYGPEDFMAMREKEKADPGRDIRNN